MVVMQLRPLLVFMACSLLLATEPASMLRQAASSEAAPIPSRDSKLQNTTTQIFFRPPDDEEPPPTRGAGSRNDRLCAEDASSRVNGLRNERPALTALALANRVGRTWAEHPTVWVYVPETSARQIVLSLREKGGQLHSQRFVEITDEAGIVGVPMDEDTPPLEVGKVYQWAVVMICGDRPNPNDPFVMAWIQRVEPAEPLNSSLSALEKAAEYAELGIWYDVLTVLAEERRSRPTDPALRKIWADFLAQPSVGLEAIADESLR